MQGAYLDIIALAERLHRQFLELVKHELNTIAVYDINSVQAMILYNIGDLEMTVSELTLSGCYLGANLSYNVKSMLESGYIVQERRLRDRRAVHVRLSEKGLALHQQLKQMHDRHIASFMHGAEAEDFVAAVRTLRKVQRFWAHTVAFDAYVRKSSKKDPLTTSLTGTYKEHAAAPVGYDA